MAASPRIKSETNNIVQSLKRLMQENTDIFILKQYVDIFHFCLRAFRTPLFMLY